MRDDLFINLHHIKSISLCDDAKDDLELEFGFSEDFHFTKTNEYTPESDFWPLESTPERDFWPIKITYLKEMIKSMETDGATHVAIGYDGVFRHYSLSAFNVQLSTPKQIQELIDTNQKIQEKREQLKQLEEEMVQLERHVNNMTKTSL